MFLFLTALAVEVAPFLLEQGPDLVSGTVTVYDASFTDRVRIHSGPNARMCHPCVGLFDTGSSPPFLRGDVFDQVMIQSDAATAAAPVTSIRVLGANSENLPPCAPAII